MSTREQRIEVFHDTLAWIDEDFDLADSVSEAKKNTTVYYEDDYPSFDSRSTKNTAITVTRDRSYQAAMRLYKDKPGSKIAVMNFANAFHAGGGVTKGSSAQEECLCRTSTLYPLLYRRTLRDSFYKHHKELNTPKASDSLIYTEGVIICKTDEDLPKRMPKEDWVTVDVITIAAPDLRAKSNIHAPLVNGGTYMNNAELYGYHVKRAIHMLTCAAAKGADTLVLGAFGCGAFQNDPEVVAKAYKTALREFPKVFDRIEFAVYCPPGDSTNYDAFSRIIDQTEELVSVLIENTVVDPYSHEKHDGHFIELREDRITKYTTDSSSGNRKDETSVSMPRWMMKEFFKYVLNYVKTAEISGIEDDTIHRTTLVYADSHKEIYDDLVCKGGTDPDKFDDIEMMVGRFLRRYWDKTPVMTYEIMPFDVLLSMKRTYDFIDDYGRNRFPNWSMSDLEKAYIGEGTKYVFSDQREDDALFDALSKLGPEDNELYADILFWIPPDNWGSRGAPFFWAYTSRHFSSFAIKDLDKDTLTREYMKIVDSFNIPFGREDWVYIEQFDGGGMSRGVVGGLFAEEALNLLLKRLDEMKSAMEEPESPCPAFCERCMHSREGDVFHNGPDKLFCPWYVDDFKPFEVLNYGSPCVFFEEEEEEDL